MTAAPVERRLRLFCRVMAMAMGVGAMIELWLVDHTGSAVQWVPFVLSALIVGSTGVVSFRMTPRAILVHRGLMLLVVLGSGYGVYAHVSHNMSFAREVRPAAAARAIWLAGVRGANPPLAAGILVAGAALGVAGTYGAAPCARADDR